MKFHTKITKHLPSLILFLFVCASTGAAQETNYKILSVENNVTQAKLSPYGGYKMLGKKSVNFADFNNFTLEFVERPQNGQPLKIVGAVIINQTPESSIVYQFETLAISAKAISFTTESKNGIYYEFTGDFLKNGEFVRYNEKKTAVLQGTLRQFKNQTESAQTSAKFSFVVWKAPYYKSSSK